jgi:predicted CoA-substrate-specific enzyme activase
MMMVAGCDVGSATGKAVIMKDGKIAAYAIIPATTKPEETARRVMDEALRKAAVPSEKIAYIVGTGYGRAKVPFANENISEITCHARGAYWSCATVRTVIDIGGQDCKVISISEVGKVNEFSMNDRCAAGTGRFLENMARALGVELQELSLLALQSNQPIRITSQCSVFAESEVISLLNDGIDLIDIAAGIHLSIAGRLSSQVRNMGVVQDVVVSGGCAKNKALISYLEKKLETKIKMLPEDPQIMGALGAALIAGERNSGK